MTRINDKINKIRKDPLQKIMKRSEAQQFVVVFI